MKYTILFLATGLLYACQNHNPYECSIDDQILLVNDSLLAREGFKESYENYLYAVDEPDMNRCSTKTYRLMNSFSWEKKIWSYRFEKQSEGGLLTLKKTYTKAYKESEGVNDTTLIRTLTSDEWSTIEKAFDSSCFWTMPVKIDRKGLDGGHYWLEAFDPLAHNPVKRDYFIAVRWSPERGTAFRHICETILEVAEAE
ncbi:hypothetical protein O3Q51_06965 [Cryomorphaceae bacterium 1068]|nr:hypothetical protein [Cryomorphaceae bacterium 1068]